MKKKEKSPLQVILTILTKIVHPTLGKCSYELDDTGRKAKQVKESAK